VATAASVPCHKPLPYPAKEQIMPADRGKLYLKAGKQQIFKRGHPWIFSGAIRAASQAAAGEVVTLCDHAGQPLASGFYNPKSAIAFRLLCHDPEVAIDHAFWQTRIARAQALRQRIIPADTNAYRVINAEGDFLPGLVVDRYGKALVVSISVLGMERLQPLMLRILTEALHPSCLYERSEGKSRLREGMAERCQWALGPGPERLEIRENGLAFWVDVAGGQKTGFFLDQRENRALLGSLSQGLSVLNCFSYSAGFSLYAIRAGARKVTSVDVSESANRLAADNLQLNQMSAGDHPLVTADVFQYLRQVEETFDLIILDPPAFAKSQHDLVQASRGYKDINLNAIKRLRLPGLLATFSCSNHVEESLFQKIVLAAVNDAGRSAQVLKVLGPGPDHPFQLAHAEGRYLKGLLLAIE